jgi:4-oxalocrotonate tautomerase
MPVLSVQMLSGRPPEKKAEYIKALAETTVRVLGVPEHAITIVVTEVDPTHWGTGLRTMAEVLTDKSGS